MADQGAGEGSGQNPGLNQPLALSDDEIRGRFGIPREVYVDQPGQSRVKDAWNQYLRLNDYSAAFAPLEGTERDRYRSIVDEARVEEQKIHHFAVETMKIITRGKPLIASRTAYR